MYTVLLFGGLLR